jgi:hypothetical protein
MPSARDRWRATLSCTSGAYSCGRPHECGSGTASRPSGAHASSATPRGRRGDVGGRERHGPAGLLLDPDCPLQRTAGHHVVHPELDEVAAPQPWPMPQSKKGRLRTRLATIDCWRMARTGLAIIGGLDPMMRSAVPGPRGWTEQIARCHAFAPQRTASSRGSLT